MNRRKVVCTSETTPEKDVLTCRLLAKKHWGSKPVQKVTKGRYAECKAVLVSAVLLVIRQRNGRQWRLQCLNRNVNMVA